MAYILQPDGMSCQGTRGLDKAERCPESAHSQEGAPAALAIPFVPHDRLAPVLARGRFSLSGRLGGFRVAST